MPTKFFDPRFYWRSTQASATNTNTPVITEFSGVVAPGGYRTGEHGGKWHEKIKNRTQAGTPMTSWRYSAKVLPATGGYNAEDKKLPNPPWSNQSRNVYKGWWYYVPQFPAALAPSGVSATDANNKALIKLYARIKEREEAFNSGPFLAELREALQMIARPGGALRDAITDHIRYVKRKRNGWLRGVPERSRIDVLTKAVAGSWLEFSFGWSPTISDVEAGASALARFVDDTNNGAFREYKRLQGSGLSSNVTLATGYLWQNSFHELTLQTRTISRLTTKYIVGHLMDVTAYPSGDARHFARNFGLNNWKNVVLGAYEIIPFSWLFDYFNNLNSILECWATPTVGVQWIVKTNRNECNRIIRSTHTGARNVPWAVLATFQAYDGTASYRSTSVIRELPTRLGYPAWEPRSPWGSSAKMANMAAVWTQMQGDFFNRRK